MESKPPTKGPSSLTKGSKMAQIIVIVVAVVVIAGAGIGIFELSKSTTTTTTVTPTPSSSSVTITVWGSGSAGGESEGFNQSLTAFEAAYPNVTVIDSPAVGVASTTYLTAAHAGTAPDVYRDTCENGAEALVAGVATNLTPYLNSSYINSFTSGTIKDWTYDGAIFGIPINTNGVALYYNKEFVPTPPSNTYQMIQDAMNVSAKGSPYIGLPYDLGADAGYRFAAWLPAFGGEIYNSTNYPEINSSASVAAMSFVWNWTVKDHIDKVGLTGAEECDLFEAGDSAFFIDGPWAQSSILKAFGTHDNEVGVAPLPFDNATGKWPAPIWGSIGYVISTPRASGMTPSQFWASLKFVEFITDNQSQVNLFKLSGDLPSLKSAGSYITNHTFNDTLIGGWIAQEKHTQTSGNNPLLEYYYSNFDTGVSDLEENSSTVTVADAATIIEKAMISDLIENGYMSGNGAAAAFGINILPSMLTSFSHVQPESLINVFLGNFYSADSSVARIL